ncbi:MAG: hypothetical protein EZS28_032035, partial [Streblomastix strix]
FFYKYSDALSDFWITKSEFSAGQCQPYIHALILFTYENGHPAKTYEEATIKKELPKRDAELWLPLPNDPNTFQIYVHLFSQCELEDQTDHNDLVSAFAERTIQLLLLT